MFISRIRAMTEFVFGKRTLAAGRETENDKEGLRKGSREDIAVSVAGSSLAVQVERSGQSWETFRREYKQHDNRNTHVLCCAHCSLSLPSTEYLGGYQ